MSERNAKRKESSWAQFYQMIHVQFPHGTIIDLKIRGGVLLGYGRIDHNKFVPRAQALEDRSAPDNWDGDWLWLWKFAQEKSDIDLREIHFRDGRPQIIPLQDPGHEYDPAEAIPWSPPNWRPDQSRHAIIAA